MCLVGKNIGIGLILHSPGARPDIDNVEALFVRSHGPVPRRQMDGNCLSAAIYNGLYVAFGRDLATSFWVYQSNVSLRLDSIGDLQILFECAQIRVNVQKIAKSDNVAFMSDSFQHFGRLSTGIYIAFLRGPSDHAAVIDCDRLVLWDSVDCYPLRYSPDTLRLCAGVRASSRVNVEARRLAPHVA